MAFIIDDILGYFGDKAQADAAKDAQAQNAALIQQQMENQQASAHTANNLLYDAMPGVQDYMGRGFQGAADFATQGFGQQRQDLMNGGGMAAGAIGQGQGDALGQLWAGAGQGVGYLNQGLQSGVGAIGGRTDRMGGMLDQPGGLYSNLQMDPGYQFRRDESLGALRSSQAAQGGRLGGAAQQALMDRADSLASQEYGNAANRRLQEFGASQGADAMSLNAQQSMAQQYANAGSQAGQMAYGAGQQGANIYGQGANSLANIYASMGQQLGNQAASAGQTLGGMTQDYYGRMANTDYGLAQQMGQNIMQGAQAGQALAPAAIANNQSTVPYAGIGWGAAANAVNSAGQLGATWAMAKGVI
jgi:hypothetical protein